MGQVVPEARTRNGSGPWPQKRSVAGLAGRVYHGRRTRGWSGGARWRRLRFDYRAVPHGRQGWLLGGNWPSRGRARTCPSARRSAAEVRHRMDGKDRLEQRATPSCQTFRWDSVHTLFQQAPDPCSCSILSARRFSTWIGPRVGCWRTRARTCSPYRPQCDPSNQMPRFRAFTCVVKAESRRLFGPLLRDAHMSSGADDGFGVRRGR